MTEQQLSAVKALAERFSSDLSHTEVVHDPHGLPPRWVAVAVYAKGSSTSERNRQNLKIFAGVSPEGDVHS